MFKILQKQHFFVEIVEMQIVITQCVKKIESNEKRADRKSRRQGRRRWRPNI